MEFIFYFLEFVQTQRRAILIDLNKISAKTAVFYIKFPKLQKITDLFDYNEIFCNSFQGFCSPSDLNQVFQNLHYIIIFL